MATNPDWVTARMLAFVVLISAAGALLAYRAETGPRSRCYEVLGHGNSEWHCPTEDGQ